MHWYDSEPVAIFIAAQKRAMVAEIELVKEPGKIVALLEESLNVAKRMENAIRIRFDAGKVPLIDLTEFVYFRIDVERQLIRARKNADSRRESK